MNINQKDNNSEHDNRLLHKLIWLFSRTGLVMCGFLVAIAFLLATGHTAHLLGYVPYLLLLACPLMHVFMHRGHGGDGSHHDKSDDKKRGCH